MAEKKISVNGKVMTFSTITEANNYILANEKNLIVTDENGNQSIDGKMQEKIEKKYVGIEFHRIISTFKSYQNDVRAGKTEKKIENIDKKTGVFQHILESRKIAAMKTAKTENAAKTEKKTENAAKTETAKTEKKLPKVNSGKKSAKKSEAIPENLENPENLSNEDLINSIIGKTEIAEIAGIPENNEAMNAAIADMQNEMTI